MWADDGFNHTGGGGFDVSGYGSPGAETAETKSSKKHSSFFPVTVRQILDSPDDGMVIAGFPVSMMCVVGILKSVEITSTKAVYKVEDFTDRTITGMMWLENENNQTPGNVVENTYCKMAGTRRVQNGEPCLMVYHISPILNLMEITHHFLQVTYMPLKGDELRQMNQDKIDAGSYMKPSALNGGSTELYSNISLTPQQMKVYRVLQQSNSESGADSRSIFESLQRQMSVQEIERVLEFLVNEGHIYCTIDDVHFKATDS